MPKAYDNDLRRKVIEAIELNGMKRCEASEYFGISRNTIHQWFQLKSATGDVKPKPTKRRGHSHKISDWEKFRGFVSAHPDKTQTAMAQLWEGDISDSEALLRSADRTISRALKKIGFTRKKRPMATESEMNKSEQTSVSS
jgi:transposase